MRIYLFCFILIWTILPTAPATAQVVSALPGLSVASEAVPDEPSQEAGDDAQTLRDKLKRRISVDLRQVPLERSLTELGRELGVTIHLDPEGLEEAGVVKDQEVEDLAAKERRGDHLLKLMLEPLNLTYELRHGVVIVTSEEKAGEHLTTRVYNVRDLTTVRSDRKPSEGTGPVPVPPGTKVLWKEPRDQSDQEWEDSDTLIDLITSAVAPDSWTDNGGMGSISYFRGLLVVSQTDAVHEELELLLRKLRAGERSQPGDVICVPEKLGGHGVRPLLHIMRPNLRAMANVPSIDF